MPISSIEDAFNALPVLLGRGAAKIVITLGENGSVVATREDPTPRHVPSKEVKPLDTTVSLLGPCNETSNFCKAILMPNSYYCEHEKNRKR